MTSRYITLTSFVYAIANVSSIQLPLKDIFEGRTPFIDYTRGKNDGFVGFHKELSDEDILNVKKTIRTINGNEITWSQIDGALFLSLLSATSHCSVVEQRKKKKASKSDERNQALALLYVTTTKTPPHQGLNEGAVAALVEGPAVVVVVVVVEKAVEGVEEGGVGEEEEEVVVVVVGSMNEKTAKPMVMLHPPQTATPNQTIMQRERRGSVLWSQMVDLM